jgi:hypothetical protein
VFIDDFPDIPVEHYQLTVYGKDSPVPGFLYSGFYFSNKHEYSGKHHPSQRLFLLLHIFQGRLPVSPRIPFIIS